MIGWVYAMRPADYQAWLSGGAPGESLASAGAKRFVEHACNTCHGDQPGARGPSLAGLFGKVVHFSDGRSRIADESYIRESIVNPQAKLVAGYPPIMPTFQGLISEEGLLQLTAYIKSLSSAPSGTGAAQTGPGLSPGPPTPIPRVVRKGRPKRHELDPGESLEAAPRQLSERRLRRALVAADHRPQAHRDPLPDRRDVLLRARRPRGGAHPARAPDARPATSSRPRRTTSSSRRTA